MKKALITGGLGFIGSALTRMLIDNGIHVIILDNLTYAGDRARIADISDNLKIIIADVSLDKSYMELDDDIDAVFHLAAESHVDRSIKEPGIFVKTNVLGTQVLLDKFKDSKTRVIVVSTDEVYGSADPNVWFEESDILRPSSPYSASKAASDMIALSYHITYGMDVLITRCTNNYGPWQSAEKLIPFSINNILNNDPCLIYGNGLQERDWVHVDDHCRALLQVFHHGKSGEIYNIGTGLETSNMEIIQILNRSLGTLDISIKHIQDRPGHDIRYAVNNEKIRSIGWTPIHDLHTGLYNTAIWYKDHQEWLRSNTASMLNWFKSQY